MAGETILVVDDDDRIRKLLTSGLTRAGFVVHEAATGDRALELLTEIQPDLVVSDVMMPGTNGLRLLARLRGSEKDRMLPVILLTALAETADIVAGLKLGADDYMTKPFQLNELVARVEAKIARPPVAREDLPLDRQTGLLSPAGFWALVRREQARSAGISPGQAVALMRIEELPTIRERFGRAAEDLLLRKVLPLLELRGADAAGRERDGLTLLLDERSARCVRDRLDAISRRLAGARFDLPDGEVRVTPSVGYVTLGAAEPADRLLERATLALGLARALLDLRAVPFEPSMEVSPGDVAAAADLESAHSTALAAYRAAPSPEAHRTVVAAHARWRAAESRERSHRSFWRAAYERARLPLQIAATQLITIGIPLVVYLWLAAIGHDVTSFMYLVVVAALLITSMTLWVEGFYALRRPGIPPLPEGDPPAASAIIAAYLPNEAATIIGTLRAFLAIEYPSKLQVILAYNTPRDLPMEDELRAFAARETRHLITVLRVEGSTSKAQNVNAALAHVTGEFVGIFDADHHPDTDAFVRASRWLAGGYDVVQGHCVVRNGDASLIASLVAVEFEGIYAVSHPGRAAFHGFGIFGGSNGYWRTAVLRTARMHRYMLTEDIDSSMRILAQGSRIASDPLLISRELAPTTLSALWAQRLRWAQGWFQVSLRHLPTMLVSGHLGLRQKVGILYLLGWREMFPFVSVQMFPIIIAWAIRYGGLERIDWVVPVFVFTSLFTLGTGPAQTLFAHALADRQIRRHRGWFVRYLLASVLAYTSFKNLVAQVAQLRQVVGEREWRVTPRGTVPAAPPGQPS